MRHNRTSQALRRAVALPFSLLACGGATAVPTVHDGGSTRAGPPDSGKTDVGPMDDASPADAPSPIDAPGLACAVVSGSGDASDNPNSPPCCFVTFTLVGPADACKPAPDGFLSNEQCSSLCPSNPWGSGGGAAARFPHLRHRMRWALSGAATSTVPTARQAGDPRGCSLRGRAHRAKSRASLPKWRGSRPRPCPRSNGWSGSSRR